MARSASVSGYSVEHIPLDKLDISEANVRRRDVTGDIDDLAQSLQEIGLLYPIVVKPKADRYEILIGQRRYLAAKQLGWDRMAARVLPETTGSVEARILSLSENVQRRDLTPRDKADACAYLLQQLGTRVAVAGRLGVSEQTVRRWLGYAAVPEALKVLVEQGSISASVATRLAQGVDDEGKAVAIAQRVAEMRPSKDQRDRILAAAEAYADRPPDVIFQRAAEMQSLTEITFVLPARWGDAMGQAARDLSKEPADVARDATIEWLDIHRY